MPEFDTITIAVLAVAIVGIIIVTAKSRLNSNNRTMDVGGNTTMSNSIYKLAMVGISCNNCIWWLHGNFWLQQ